VTATSPSIDPAEAHQPLRRRLVEPALIGLLALTLNLAGNGRVSLWDRDEPRYAVCTREMRARGDWIYPTFNGEPRYHKPVLIYWLMRAGYALGGDNPFGARLVSGLAGAATCLITWDLGRRMLGPQAGRLAALMLATAPIVVAESKLATTDATLALFVVAGQACLWELSRRPSRGLAAAFWVLMALAMLTKGPVGLALVAASGLASWWWRGPSGCWRRLEWRRGPALFALVCAPWFVAVGVISNGEFFRYALGNQALGRVVTGVEQHGGFPGYYVATSLATFHPWSALLPAALLGAWWRRRSRPEFGFLLGWVVGPLILLECVPTKLVHYYLPSYPACALLAAWLVVAVAADEVNLRRWPLGGLGLGLLGGVAFGATVVLIAAAVVTPAPVRWPCLALAAAVGSGSLYALERLRSGATHRAMTALVATWAVVMLGVGAWLLPSLEPYRTHRIVGQRLASIADRLKVAPVMVTFQEPSIVYAVGYPVPEIRQWEQLHAIVGKHGAVVTAALVPQEVVVFQKRPDFDVEVLPDTLSGFNLSKGKSQTLRFLLLRERTSTVQAARPQPALAK
jgi:4-amino-4-deoxy-L-arabinose transferase-like glycosyltransferase